MSQPYGRIFNFSAGPAVLPVEVMEQARDEMMNYAGTGMSVMEMSHRSKPFEGIINDAEATLRQLLGVPEDYTVLFLQGGASLQFTMVPMAFLAGGEADFVLTGSWGKKAVEAARLHGKANVVFDAKPTNYDRAPKVSELSLTPGAKYLHITLNETIQGVDFMADPEASIPVVCDMSSNILSRKIDVSKYALIYAGAQKNLGPAGVTVVIVRNSFLEQCAGNLPPMLDYKLQAENQSLYNTPPCWTIYICGLCFRQIAKNGGLEAVEARNEAKAKLIYDAIDGSGGFFKGHAQPANRSRMNIAFTLPSDEMTTEFLSEAKSHGMSELKGHRSVGGCRASVYNAFPVEGCEALAQFMAEFATQNA